MAGHIAAKCYLKIRKDVRVNKLGVEPKVNVGKFLGSRKNDIKCYNCGERARIARECRKTRNPKRLNQVGSSGAEDRPPDKSKWASEFCR
jgi:hypothetical protein